jgi:hypothetical protein
VDFSVLIGRPEVRDAHGVREVRDSSREHRREADPVLSPVGDLELVELLLQGDERAVELLGVGGDSRRVLRPELFRHRLEILELFPDPLDAVDGGRRLGQILPQLLHHLGLEPDVLFRSLRVRILDEPEALPVLLARGLEHDGIFARRLQNRDSRDGGGAKALLSHLHPVGV